MPLQQRPLWRCSGIGRRTSIERQDSVPELSRWRTKPFVHLHQGLSVSADGRINAKGGVGGIAEREGLPRRSETMLKTGAGSLIRRHSAVDGLAQGARGEVKGARAIPASSSCQDG